MLVKPAQKDLVESFYCSSCESPRPYEGPYRRWHWARTCDQTRGGATYLKAYLVFNEKVLPDGSAPVEVLQLLLDAADMGSTDAMYALGLIYQRRQDKARYAAWMDLAAEPGHRCALLRRGTGWLGSTSLDISNLDLRRAMCKGCLLACYELCSSHCLKNVDDERARVPLGVLARAARLGHPNAARYLAAIYMNGLGVKRSSLLTAFWAKRGHELGNPICSTWLRKNAPKELRPEN